ncbi:GL25487 [Drosophila persimilis]|uniref:GL25487 n=1 Tax=Drosophila persimilis TaxID=7234 RepID=B4HBG6_DROPE|nr:GL25487 [Drosophila persimilis]
MCSENFSLATNITPRSSTKRKLSARCVPHLFNPDNKRTRETIAEQCLILFMRNPKEFLRRFVTFDETKKRPRTGERALKKAKTVADAHGLPIGSNVEEGRAGGRGQGDDCGMGSVYLRQVLLSQPSIKLSVLQLDLHKSKVSSAELLNAMEQEPTDIVLALDYVR